MRSTSTACSASTSTRSPTATPTDPGFTYLAGKFWNVDEEVLTGYLRGDLDHELGNGVQLKGNVGLQVISTDQSSDGFFIANGAVFRDGDGKSYTDILPQLNFAFLLDESQAIRFGLAEEMARPRMDQLKATEESGYDGATGIPGGSGGNPRLDPWRALGIRRVLRALLRGPQRLRLDRGRSTRTSTPTSSRRPRPTTTTRTCWR